jgi:hypothetical protein
MGSFTNGTHSTALLKNTMRTAGILENMTLTVVSN